MASKNIILTTPITIEELAKEMREMQGDEYLIFVNIETTKGYFKAELQKRGVNATYEEIRKAMRILNSNESIKILQIPPNERQNELSGHKWIFTDPLASK